MENKHIQTFKVGHALYPSGCTIQTVIAEDGGVTVTETPGDGDPTITIYTPEAWLALQQSQPE